MSPSTLPPQILKLLPLLGSDKDGEVVATARAICRTLSSAGIDLHHLAAALSASVAPSPCMAVAGTPGIFDMARACRDLDCGRLTQPEKKFVGEMCRLGTRSPSFRQIRWLSDIYAKLHRRAAA